MGNRHGWSDHRNDRGDSDEYAGLGEHGYYLDSLFSFPDDPMAMYGYVTLVGSFHFIGFCDFRSYCPEITASVRERPTKSSPGMKVGRMDTYRRGHERVVQVHGLNERYPVVAVLRAGRMKGIYLYSMCPCVHDEKKEKKPILKIDLKGYSSDLDALCRPTKLSQDPLLVGDNLSIFNARTGEDMLQLDPGPEWNSEHYALARFLPQFPGSECFVITHPASQIAIYDDDIFAFDLDRDGEMVARFHVPDSGQMRNFDALASKNMLVSGTDLILRLWDRRTQELTSEHDVYHRFNIGINALACADEHNLLLLGSNEGVHVFDVRQMSSLVRLIPTSRPCVECFDQFSESVFIAGTINGSMSVFDVLTGKIFEEGDNLARLGSRPGEISSLCVLREFPRGEPTVDASQILIDEKERVDFLEGLDFCVALVGGCVVRRSAENREEIVKIFPSLLCCRWEVE